MRSEGPAGWEQHLKECREREMEQRQREQQFGKQMAEQQAKGWSINLNESGDVAELFAWIKEHSIPQAGHYE